MEPDTRESPPQSADDQNRQLRQEVATLRREIDRLSRIEQMHAHQSALMKQLIDLIPIGVAIHTSGAASFINPAGVAIMRAENADEILDTPAIEFVHPDFREEALARIQSLAAAKQTASPPIAPYLEEKFLRLDGEIIDVEVTAFPLTQSDSEDSVLVLFQDITERKQQQQALLEREARFRQLVSLLPDATIIHRNGGILFANETAVRLLGGDSAEDIVGLTLFDFLHPDEHEKVRARMKKILQTSKPLPPENEYIVRFDGEIFLAEIMAFPFEEKDGNAILAVFHDVTERDQMLKALEKSEARFRMLAELLPASVFIINEEGKLLYINAASQTILGYSVDEFLKIGYQAIFDAESLEMADGSGDTNVGDVARFEARVRGKEGDWRWLDVTITKTILDDDIVGLGVATDVTWRKETETLLKRQAQELVKAYEEERSRIARELHDEVGQQLIGMKFALETAQHHVKSEEAIAALYDARQILADLTEQVRELSLSFRPSMLDDLGLLPTLLWLFEHYTERTGIHVQFSHMGLRQHRFSPAVEITVFRIIQESLTNVARHARVDAVTVTVQATDGAIDMTIRDNGVGFKPEVALGSYASSGLSGMKERVRLLGGELIIESAPGRGVTIAASVPLLEG